MEVINIKLSIKKTTFISLLIAFTLISYFIESLLPPLIPAVSGARLGISNIFIIYALYAFGWKYALIIAITKSLLGPILVGSPTGIFFSITGSFLSLTTMSLIKYYMKSKLGVMGVSVLGSFMHNLGQMIIAMLFTGTGFIILYFPILSLVSVPCGIIIGITSDRLLKITSGITIKYKNKISRRKTT